MFDLKTRALLHHTTSKKKLVYKRRIMVGDVLANKILYADFPDNFMDITDLEANINPDRSICKFNNSSPGSYETWIHEYTDTAFEYGIYVGDTSLRNNIYFYNLETNKLEVNKNEYKMSGTIQDVTEITDCQAYRHLYIEDQNIRPLKVGDVLTNGTKLYFNIPDDISERYTAYKYPPSALMPLAVEPDSDVTLTLIDKFLSITYYDSITDVSTRIVNITLSDGSSNTSIFKAQHFGQPKINISSYIMTNTIAIKDYNEFDFWSQFILVDPSTLADSSNVSEFRYRAPEFTDNLSGKVMKFKFPSDPISQISYNARNNEYLVSTGSNGGGYEAVMYDTTSQADDYSWDVQTFTAIVEVGGIRVYECVTTVKTTYDTSTGTQTSQVVQSVDEKIKKEYIVLPDDFGTLIRYNGSIFGIYPEIDDLSTTKRDYKLSNLTTSDKITSDGLLLLPQFPTNIDKVWFPTVPSANEYGQINLGDEYTLFSVEKEYTAPGAEYPSSYAYSVQAIISANGTYDSDYNFIADGTYNFSIMGSEMMQSTIVCSKQYGSDTTYQWNIPLQVPGFDVDIPLSTLNTSSPLLQYMKKITWL